MRTAHACADEIYAAVLSIRYASAPAPSGIRSSAVQLMRLATEFDERVAQARARAPHLRIPGSVRRLREDLIEEQRRALASIAEQFLRIGLSRWQRCGAAVIGVCVAISALSAALAGAYADSLTPDVGGARQLALLMGGAWPMALAILLVLYFTAIHLAAFAAGQRTPDRSRVTAAHPWISALIIVHTPMALLAAVGVACILAIGGVALSAHEVASVLSASG